MPDKLDNTKELQKKIGILNYARNFIKDLGKVAGPLYSKTGTHGQKTFNIEDIKLVQKLKHSSKRSIRSSKDFNVCSFVLTVASIILILKILSMHLMQPSI